MVQHYNTCCRPVDRAVMRCLWSERSEIQISGPSNRKKGFQRFATAAIFLRNELCCLGALTRRRALQTRYTLRHITASIMKDWIQYLFSKITRPCLRACQKWLKHLFYDYFRSHKLDLTSILVSGYVGSFDKAHTQLSGFE